MMCNIYVHNTDEYYYIDFCNLLLIEFVLLKNKLIGEEEDKGYSCSKTVFGLRK